MSGEDANADMIADSAAKFAAQAVGLGLLGRAAPDHAGWLTALAEASWPGLLASESDGGSALPIADFCIVCEEFGRKLLPGFAPLAAALGVLGEDTALRADILARAMNGEALVAPALQSESARPSAGHGATLAPTDGGGWRLDGAKHFVPDGDTAEGFVVDARGPDGLALLYVPRRAAGVSTTVDTAADGARLARVEFANVGLDGGHVIAMGPRAAAALDRLRFPLQLGLAAELIGLAREVFDRTLDYMRTRRQFGRSLGAFQALQHRAVDMACDIELSRAYVLEAARVADAPRPGVLELIAGARARAGETALAVAKWAIQMHGAIGFTDEFDIGLFLKRALTLTRIYRTIEAHRARFREATSGANALDLFGLLRADTAQDASFRAEVRAFHEAALPARLRDLPLRPAHEDALWWHRQLHARGWIAPNWPREHGGMDATIRQRLILLEEAARAGAPELSNQAIYHIGPIIIRFGTPEQKARHLPPMLDGNVTWCQGYSEPNSGSDLVSLRARGEVRGDRVIINGQKIWTTAAHHAQWMFALVRTNPDAADRREGISMILVDMAAKGVRPRAIKTITGDDEFAEVFFDDVEVPLANVVGELNGGWKLANAVLENERLMTSTPQRVNALLDRVDLLARETGAFDDIAFADRLARARIDAIAYSAAFARQLERMRVAGSPGQASSLLKIVNTELQQRLADLLLEAAGSAGASLAFIEVGGRRLHPALTFLQARRNTIYGGTSEIQRNIVARRLLDLGNDKRGERA